MGINPLEFPGRSAVQWSNSLGLLFSFLLLSAIYYACVVIGTRVAGQSDQSAKASGRLIYSIIPVSLVFHFSHYLTSLLVNGQYAVLAVNDPYARGWNLLGLEHFHVTASFLNRLDIVSILWQSQTITIVVGHIVGIVVAHGIALQMFGHSRAVFRGQLLLAIFMIAYTLFGLWLLSTATVG
jgi:hypothetical protein